MTYEELVKQVKEIAEGADVSKIEGHVAFQFNIEGKAPVPSIWRSRTEKLWWSPTSTMTEMCW